MKSKLFPLLVPVLSASVVLTSCGQADEPQQSAADNGVTVTNCGKGGDLCAGRQSVCQ
nr:hypothetical protein FRC0402_00400 [Corynebacterium diphtheriae]